MKSTLMNRVLLTSLQACGWVLLLSAGDVKAEPLVVPNEPEWVGSRNIESENGYMALAWLLDEETEYAEFYRLEETYNDVVETSYIAENELVLYRTQPGRHEFRVAGCVRSIESDPLCGEFSKTLKLNIPESVEAALFDDEAVPEINSMVAEPGGPDDLRPGLWYDPDYSGQGWSLYWANRLALPEGSANHGYAYDLYGIWYTFEAKTKIEEDPVDCPSCPPRYTNYRPVVVIFKGVKTGSNAYSGGIYVTRNGNQSQIGNASISFGSNNTQAQLNWSNVTFLKGQTLSGSFDLQTLTASSPSDVTNSTYLGGLWGGNVGSNPFVVNDLGHTAEGLYVILRTIRATPFGCWVPVVASLSQAIPTTA